MRILQINSVCGIGSTGRIATDIHAILLKEGHESYIAYGRNNPLNCNNAIRIGNKLDNYLHVARTRILDQHGLGSKKATHEFITKVKKFNPDVIHLHNIHGYYINLEILFDYLKEDNKPIVWTLHDCWPFTGHCTHFEYAGCDCWKIDGNHKCIQKSSYPASFMFNNSRDNYKRKRKAFTGLKNLTIVTPSKWLAEIVKKSFLREYPIKVINNGVDIEVFKPTESNFREKNNIRNKFVILGVANVWGQKKGYEYFIELSKKISEDEIILLVGLSEKQMVNLPNNIIGITRTNNVSELAEIFTSADVFVNPTLEDNFPTTNLESLACGTPVITFDTGGSGESIGANCGSIIKNRDLENIIEQKNVIKRMGKHYFSENCLNHAKTMYNKNDRYNEYIKLYTTIAGD